MDGAVYEWNAFTGKREGESVLKSCSYTSVSSTPDAKSIFAVGSDRTLKEISDSQVRKCLLTIFHSNCSKMHKFVEVKTHQYEW